ncbi:hypothetical protein PENSTE_c039G02708 [Penicillium steckii]|uniref:Uncharacterized protein n=1 Tax=Penicillium steckii TaxID=303698 RepID=A0A1V6SJ96_9EURO|nr:hypothetical protein PENSTE_c039G02708 [Penicillium steckii]
MSRYLVKFRPFVNEKERQEFTSELAQNGGHLVKNRRFRTGSIYEIPGEDLDIQNFDTRKFVDVSEKRSFK